MVHARPSSRPAAPRTNEPEQRLSKVAPLACAARSTSRTSPGYSDGARTAVADTMTRSESATPSNPWVAVTPNGDNAVAVSI